MHLCSMCSFFLPQCTEKCIESISESEYVIFETVAEVYSFRVIVKCISCLWADQVHLNIFKPLPGIRVRHCDIYV